MTELRFLKYVLTIAIVALLVINSIADPHNLAFFAGESRLEYKPETRATTFALIAAIAAIVNIIPTGRRKLPIVIHIIGIIAPLAGAALAGWFALYAATENNPLPYLQEIGNIGLLVVYLAIGIGLYAFFFHKLWVAFSVICSLALRGIRASLPQIKVARVRVANWCSVIGTASSNQIRRFLRR